MELNETPYQAQRRKLRDMKSEQDISGEALPQISAKAAARRAVEASSKKVSKKVSKKKTGTSTIK